MSCTHRRDFIKHSVLALGALGIAQAAEESRVYVCPPCGCPMDGREFDKPGTCPACGMTLVEKGAQRESTRARPPGARVAILVFDGVQIIDFAAPYEVFGEAGYEVFTVGATKAPVTTTMGLLVTPRFAFADDPQFDVLVIPGGAIHAALRQEPLLDWIRARAADAKHTLSVCNGAFFLAHAGLLRGLTATTYHGAIRQLQQHGIAVVTDQRFVDNGKIITSAGLSSGIDGALHVVAKLSGRGAAQLVALNMEYDWDEEGSFVRASLPDYRFLHPIFGARMQLNLPAGYTDEVESTRGDRSSWATSWLVETGHTPVELVAAIATVIESRSGLTAGGERGEALRRWHFTDERDQPWTAQLSASTTDKAGVLRARLHLAQMK